MTEVIAQFRNMPDQFGPLQTPSIFELVHLSQLRGKTIFLEPLEEKHRNILRSLAKDERIWEFTRTLLLNDTYEAQFNWYFDEAMEVISVGGQSFIIRQTSDNTPIGMTRLFEVSRKDKRLEIGYTWYLPAVWGKVHNKECKLLLLQYAFETLGFNRVQFKVAHQNIRSQKAVEKIGGIREGVLRKHGYRGDGSIRDTVMFSIIDEEWPEKKARLLEMIAAAQ